jgi:hypothetical protein
VPSTTLSLYERSALGDAFTEVSPYRTPLSALAAVVASWTERDERPRVRKRRPVVDEVLGKLLLATSHLAALTVRENRLSVFRRLGMRPMRSLADIPRLDLWEVDEASSFLQPKYMALGALLGAGAGAFGVRGLVAETPLVTGLGMRLIHEYAKRYGFDIHDESERAFAARVFITAISPQRQLHAHAATVADLAPVTEAVTRLSSVASVLDAVRGVAKRALRSRVGRVLPVVAAVAGAALNVWLLRGIAKTAQLAYRERFVARKHHVMVDALPAPEISRREPDEACPPGPCEKNDVAPHASVRSAAEQ